MGSAKRKRLPAETGKLRERIEEWRRTRERQGRMPAELWAGAVSLAESHGVYRIARAVGVNYGSLKWRVGRPGAVVGETPKASGGFVELSAVQVVGTGIEPTATVELTACDGAKLTVRLRACGAVDLTKLADAFWRRSP